MLKLNDGRNELWQWDTGRKLTVDADCSQVHFSNKIFGRSIDVDAVDGVASIPDVLLQTDKDMTAWAFVGTAENGYTKISKTFKVNKRSKPADYVFTPQDQTTLEEITERLEDLENQKRPAGFVKTVNGIEPDKNGNIDIPTGTGNAVQYVTQTLTDEQKQQARENIGAAKEQVPLSASQINALNELFKSASYIKDVSAEYAAFCDAFGLTEPDLPDVVTSSVKKGSVGFSNGNMILEAFAARATLVPIGRYLKKGTMYKLSIGNIDTKYSYGVSIFVASSAGMTFPYSDEKTIYSGVNERLVDTGWRTTDYTYTPDVDNCILAVNFKLNAGGNLGENNYAEILENFVFEEIV